MEAVLLALKAFAVHVRGHSVLLATDNTTVAAYVNKQGGTHSQTLCNLAVEIALWCTQNKVHIKARYLPGRLNALADCLSRKGNIVQTEWSLSPRVASQIFHIWGKPHLDLFATRLNGKLPLFVSPVLDPEAYATDALSLSWRGMWAYAFPPFPLILPCLKKIQEEECLVCLIAPLWEGQAWFPLLLSLLVAPAVRLPLKKDLLYQPISIDFSSQSVLSDVVRSFELERPRTRPHFPKWDIAVVLSALNSSPFEPLDSCGFKELTFKTVFLTALASGRRRSEIHALSCSDVQFSDQSVSLSTFPGFLAKNQLPSVLSSPISLPSLSGQDSLLCPVRALKIYLERVLSRRKGRKRLFISHLDSYDKEISCDTISRWIVQTIKLAYGTRKLNQVSVNAHEVRALASSWAWSNKVPLDDIVKAGFWSSENSFIKFYLRDVSILASSLASLGPVVAAQAVVVPVTSVL